MAFAIAASLLFVVVDSAAAENSIHPLSDEFISLINSKQNTWEAGRNFPADTPLTYIKGLMGALPDPPILDLPVQIHSTDLIASLPENFDPRDKWPNCPSLNDIRDQGSCGSCWAFGAVEAMTDLVCTHSNGTKNFYFSAQDLTSCGAGLGCDGGWPSVAFQHWHKVGIVSGGPYNSSQGCRPYEIPPCEHHVNGNRPKCHDSDGTPDCVKKCAAGYKVEYNQDKQYAKRVYHLSGEDDIKAELYNGGPVAAGFTVYEDFVHYKSGVYSHTAGEEHGGHVIKIMGWGVENGKKYWLCANSWNSDWGNKGFFKILRGENHCDIESSVTGGEPALG